MSQRPIEVRPRTTRNILSVPKQKGMVRRLVRNEQARIEEMEELGYTVVKAEDGGPLTRRELIVMQTPERMYAERQAEKVAAIRAERAALTKNARREMERQASEGAFRGKASIIGSGVELTGGQS